MSMSPNASTRKRSTRDCASSSRISRTVNRLSMMGELTASLAHEILHPIATARNNARAAMRFLDISPPTWPRSGKRSLVSSGMPTAAKTSSTASVITSKKHLRGMTVSTSMKPSRRSPKWCSPNREEHSLGSHPSRARPEFRSGRSCSTATSRPQSGPERGRSDGLGCGGGAYLDDQNRERCGRHSGRGSRFGTRHRSGASAARLRPLLHDQGQRTRNGLVDLPVDHRRAWGPFVGRCRSAARSRISVHLARATTETHDFSSGGPSDRRARRRQRSRWSSSTGLPR